MAALRAAKSVDRVQYEDVMLNLSKARALAWFLEQLGDEDSELRHGIRDSYVDVPKCTVEWAQQAIANGLREAHDGMEKDYRRLRAGDTDGLLDKVATLAKEGA